MLELARKLLILKRGSKARVHHWRAYVKTFLKNKASNWGRDWHKRRKKRAILETLHDQLSGEILPGKITSLATADDIDSRIAFEHFWKALSPKLQRTLKALGQKNGNQVAAARYLRVHRNTIALRLKKIEHLAKKHELDLFGR